MKQKFEKLGVVLSRNAQKKLIGGEGKTDEIDPCNDSCSSHADCPVDRYCGTGVCGTDTSKTIKACFRF
ncbi:MAG: hypothetical protein EAZ12_06865 [Sphingobacteriia bacterium]|nr:MAG: hypothetical protein EAZ12_06865 [Sphingobacteriia bacterium]